MELYPGAAGERTKGTGRDEYVPDGPIARRIASVTPYFPFKQIPRFYDIGGFLADPEAFRLVVEVLVNRYASEEITSVCGLDARGFVLGPPVALALKKPFVMLRKKGKMPNAVSGAAYSKEYEGSDSLAIPRGSVGEGDRVLIVDDLVATGGTLCAAIELVKAFGGIVVECACVVEIKFLNARAAFNQKGFSEVNIWALMTEDILQLDGLADPNIKTEGYVDDGLPH